MTPRSLLALAVMSMALGAGKAAQAECKLQMLGSVPISFVNNQPMVDGSINGKPAHFRFTLSTQAIFWGSALKDYGLKEAVGYSLGMASGPGGRADATAVQIRELKIGDVTQKNAYLYVLYSIQKTDEAGIYGNSLFSGSNDIEIDFPHNIVRIFSPVDCKDDDVVYWGGNYSAVDYDKQEYLKLKIGDKAVRGSLAFGNEVTFVTMEGAREAGVSLQAAGPLPMSMVAGGMIKPVDVSIANFPELSVGDEIIKNAPLAVGDVFPDARPGAGPGVILGSDFARSHRIYLSWRQRRMYFSYTGGTLFQDIYARLGAPAPAQRSGQFPKN